MIHGTAFTTAAAVLFVTLDRAFLAALKGLGLLQKLVLVLLVCLSFLATTVLVYQDATSNPVAPHQVTDTVQPPTVQGSDLLKMSKETKKTLERPGSMTVWEYETILHDLYDNLPPKPSDELADKNPRKKEVHDAALSVYSKYAEPYKEKTRAYRLRDELGRMALNRNYYVSAAVTWIFAAMITCVYVPALIATMFFLGRLSDAGVRIKELDKKYLSAEVDGGRKQGLLKERTALYEVFDKDRRYYRSLWADFVAFFILILFWFPFRMYATYYQGSIISIGEDYAYLAVYLALWILAVLALFFYFILSLMQWGAKEPWKVIAFPAGLGTILSGIAYFSPDVRAFGFKVIESFLGNFAFLLTFYLGLIVLTGVIVYILTLRPFDDDKDPAPRPALAERHNPVQLTLKSAMSPRPAIPCHTSRRMAGRDRRGAAKRGRMNFENCRGAHHVDPRPAPRRSAAHPRRPPRPTPDCESRPVIHRPAGTGPRAPRPVPAGRVQAAPQVSSDSGRDKWRGWKAAESGRARSTHERTGDPLCPFFCAL